MATGWLSSVDDLAERTIHDREIVVLPLGATEQHGPHLPLETDAIIAQGMCDHLIKALPGNISVYFLPVEQIGYSVEHMDHQGTQSLTWQDATRRWIGLGNACKKHGVDRFVMLNAHGGNSPLMTVVAQELRVLSDMIAVATSWTRFVKNSGIVSADEEAFGIHGGDVETSVMLALRPDLVDMGKAENFTSLQQHLTENYQHLRAYGPHSFGWKAADLNKAGVVGDAAVATAEKGERLIARAVEGLSELIVELRNFELPK